MLTNISFCLLDNYTFSNIEALVGYFDKEHRKQRHSLYKACSASSSAYAQRDTLRNHLYRHEFGNCYVELYKEHNLSIKVVPLATSVTIVSNVFVVIVTVLSCRPS
jgi:hypothetical protein